MGIWLVGDISNWLALFANLGGVHFFVLRAYRAGGEVLQLPQQRLLVFVVNWPAR